MSPRRIRAHYEQLSEFERGRLDKSEYRSKRSAIRRCCDESRFQLRPEDTGRRVWRPAGQRANTAFTIERTQAPKQELTSGVLFLLTAGHL
ncbi:hypothetical protein TNCV_4174901 [Trichonephila clavipes]|nr:hypothetical protein TNCV_4174901 [Trichonephila clavipes]